MLVAAALAVLGGLVYWAPLIWGGRFPEGPSMALAGGGLLGTILYCLPDLISGFLGQADFTGVDLATAGYPDSGTGALNAVSTVGAAAFLVAGLIWMVAGVRHLAADSEGAG